MTRTKLSNVGLVNLWTAVYVNVSCSSKRHVSGYRGGCDEAGPLLQDEWLEKTWLYFVYDWLSLFVLL